MGQVLGAEAGPFPDKVGAEIALGQHSARHGGHLELLQSPEGQRGRRVHGVNIWGPWVLGPPRYLLGWEQQCVSDRGLHQPLVCKSSEQRGLGELKDITARRPPPAPGVP